ncbi:MAG TPA: DUF1800 domain-containing protein [Verrucomicrobiae bacterium]|nr:DUF1800 domain-containing protein [Verrucomicrobiae bacterium]
MLKPIAAAAWDVRKAAHLLNRAGFGGKPVEVARFTELGASAAVEELVDFQRIPDPTADPEWAKPDPERIQRLADLRKAPEPERRELQRQEQRLQRERLLELRLWWLNRMAFGPRPLQEKLTLFWHGHFATSFEKVRDAYYMWRQNELFRRIAVGNWRDILVEVGTDPAMLIWLDQGQSRKEKPNENFAREVMELFALGEGHYTEKDVAEAARAFTGWTLDRAAQRFVTRPRWHDEGEKVILGKTGNFTGEDVIEIIVNRPEAATFITGRLWQFFTGEFPAPALNAALAAEFRRCDKMVGAFLRTMFLCEEFYAQAVIGNQVKSPVQWLVGSVRLLERQMPTPRFCLDLLRSLGQELFAPPNVKGWDGGTSWISTNTLMARYTAVPVLVDGEAPPQPRREGNPDRPQRRQRPALKGGIDPMLLFSSAERADKRVFLDALQQRLLQGQLRGKAAEQLREYVESAASLDPETIKGAIRLVLGTTDYQLS